MKRFQSVVLLSALFAACESRSITIPDDAVPVEASALLSDLQRSSYDGIGDRRRLLVTDTETWAALWAEMTQGITPQPSRPVIDFSTESVILVSMGVRPTGGYAITIEGVEESGGTLYVRVHERSPGRNCFTTQAQTAPVEVVRIAGRHSSVAFVERASVKSC